MDKSQPELTLYHFPNACSQVAVCALEAAGLTYGIELVDLAGGEQNGDAYKAINPLGKVPLLLIDGQPLTENVAILTYIAGLRPEAGLLPVSQDPLVHARAIGGMAFCGGTLHPIIRGMANPQRMTTGEGAPVREKSIELADKSYRLAEARLAAKGWWLGEWSIIDVYLNWTLSVALNAGYDVGKFPTLRALPERLTAIPAFARMQEVNAAGRAALAKR